MSKRLTTEIIIKRSIDVHGDRYDYSLVDYINAKTKVKIICPIHGVFTKTIVNHIDKCQGCPECSKINQYDGYNTFIMKCKLNHGDRYDYSLVDYINAKTKVKIICPIHGVFTQIAGVHSSGHGCPKCKNDKLSKLYSTGKDLFVSQSNDIHNGLYDYSLVDYINNRTKVKIVCPIHGTFEQIPDGHINQQQGCPKCSLIISKPELELQEWLGQHIDILTNDRSIISPYELDIVIPSHKIAIEYNGLYWHSEQRSKDRNYHLNKYNMCKDKGYRLIQIWENEWLTKQDIVKSIILNAIGKHTNKIHGRKCTIKHITPKEARPFYNNNHIQGFKGGEHHGLYYNDELVSLLTIDKVGELQRFVNKINTIVHGAFSKLLKSFDHKEIYTFADLRYFTGNVYIINGFEYVQTIPPRYWWWIGRKTVYHRRSFQKQYMSKKLDVFNPDKTEYQNMLNNGYDRIWDCGKIKYLFTKQY